GVASSSPLELIEYALALADLRSYFTAVVSSDEVEHGKPAPDVYLLACQRLHAAPDSAAAVEDSASGIKAAAVAGLAVVAIPNLVFAPSEEALAMADVVLGSVAELTPAVVDQLAERREPGSRGGAGKSRE
ncbi:MAG: HAD-IA family hydrolase, partial [Thermoleophilia bacterium]|nr:HAD-IA family hydrolase [Thermoleophilia bacterium]